MLPQRKSHVVENGKVRQQRPTLEQHPHLLSKLVKFVPSQRMNILAIQHHSALQRSQLTSNQAQEGGLPGTAWSHDGRNFAASDIQTDIIKDDAGAIAITQVPDGNQALIAVNIVTHGLAGIIGRDKDGDQRSILARASG